MIWRWFFSARKRAGGPFPVGRPTRADVPLASPIGNPLRANPARGEACVAGYNLRPTFTALVAAEAELGPLFGVVERAAAGELRLAETAALLWHCVEGEQPERAVFAEALAAAGLAAITPALRVVLSQILQGR